MSKFNYNPVFLTEEASLELEAAKLMNEEFSAESFMTWATRKLKGYSVAEIDHLAKRAVNIKTHEEKTDLIERIRDAVTAANKKLIDFRKTMDKTKEVDRHKEEYLKEHLSVLQALLSRSQSFNILAHLDNEKKEQEEERRRVFKIGHNT
jgi:hypothetical protein